MGDVFCLVILQNGNRRKLKLATGTYAEFLEKLTAIVDVDLENTLVHFFHAPSACSSFYDVIIVGSVKDGDVIFGVPALMKQRLGCLVADSKKQNVISCPEQIQMFDSDLDDFVDLAPEDDIPNKAKLRVVSRSTSILCNAAAVAAGQNVVPSHNVAPSCSQGSIVTRIEDAPCAVLSYRQMSGSDEMQIEDTAISHTSMHDNDDYLKFQLPPSFGIWCDTFLRSKQPVTAKVKTHIISHLFKACYKMTPCPTPRLYNKVLDSLVAKYPHVMEGKYNRRRWLIALRSRFKSERENLTGASAPAVEAQETSGLDLSQPDADYACTYTHTQHAKTQLSSSAYSPGCEDKSVHEEHLGEFTNSSGHGAETYVAGHSDTLPLDSMCRVSDPVECLESEEDEESMDCPNHSDGLLEDETVSSLLRSCSDEKASEALMAQQEKSGFSG
ncbi:hypothetical protein HPB51_015055 [Rhipicephalus microplus]|uniref:Uncharacterized protein n=1 Tax=Rhipicephalus microplus TaxID=6941 RepID=A0A9J6ETS4_RHIMP|nr:hypothetical protein HPB51_015055 [Rhipicephalus microplus]